MELLRLLVAVGELSEAGGRRTGEERRIVHLSATQLHPTPARLWWSLRPCQRVKQRLLPRNLFSASATPRQPVSPRQPSGPQHGAGTLGTLPALPPQHWGWHGAEEPITRSPLIRLDANAELVRTAFFWKLLVEDAGQSGWLSNRRTHFQKFLYLSFCSSV